MLLAYVICECSWFIFCLRINKFAPWYAVRFSLNHSISRFRHSSSSASFITFVHSGPDALFQPSCRRCFYSTQSFSSHSSWTFTSKTFTRKSRWRAKKLIEWTHNCYFFLSLCASCQFRRLILTYTTFQGQRLIEGVSVVREYSIWVSIKNLFSLKCGQQRGAVFRLPNA